MAMYTVQQHDSFMKASYRRKHLNALILDYSKEYDKTQQTTGVQHAVDTAPASSSATVPYSSTLLEQLAVAKSYAADECQQQPSLGSNNSYNSSMSSSSSSQQQSDNPPSWLMPWQTGDRTAGRQLADSIRTKRTPNGGFAIHDLPVAPK